MIITKELAQPIVDKMMAVIDYNINIMNHEGIIVGSGDMSRLNKEHKGALEAISLKREKIIYLSESDKYGEVKPGVNLPIEFNNEIIGTVGITGNPKIIYKLSQLVKISVESLIKQQYLNEKLLYRKNNIEKWVFNLINANDNYKELEEQAIQMQIDVKTDTLFMLIHVEELVHSKGGKDISKYKKIYLYENRFLQTISFHQSDIIFIARVNDGKYLLAVQENANSTREKIMNGVKLLFNSLTAKKWSIKIGVSMVQSGIEGYRNGYHEALQSIELMLRLEPNKGVSSITDWGVVRYIDQIPRQVRKNFQNSILNNKESIDLELFRTLEKFLRNDMKIGLTANELFIHRNTLLYRLDRISEIWKLNPRNFNDAFKLQLLLLCMKLDEEELVD